MVKTEHFSAVISLKVTYLLKIQNLFTFCALIFESFAYVEKEWRDWTFRERIRPFVNHNLLQALEVQNIGKDKGTLLDFSFL